MTKEKQITDEETGVNALIISADGTHFWVTRNQFLDWVKAGLVQAISESPMTGELVVQVKESARTDKYSITLNQSMAGITWYEKDVFQPPRFAEYLIYLTPKSKRKAIAGDLQEEYSEVLSKFGPRGAKVWYYKQAFTLFTPLVLKAIGWGLLTWLVSWVRRLSL